MSLSTLSTKCVARHSVCALFWLAGSAATAAVGDGVAAPQLAVGDHWQYRVTDNLRRGALAQLSLTAIH